MNLLFNHFPFLSSFLAGILTFASPCLLPLIPLYLSFITGMTIEHLQKTKVSPIYLVLNTFFFIIGFTIIFVLLGTTAIFLGSFLNFHHNIFKTVGGIIIIIFGLHILGVKKFKFFYQEKHWQIKNYSTNYINSLLVGMIFAFSWTPCVGPILSSVLILASTEKTVYKGILLLIGYSLGLGLPFLLLSLSVGFFLRVFFRLKKFLKIIEIFTGIILILMGIFLIKGF